MKRIVFQVLALVGAMNVNGQNTAALYDSTQVEALQEVVVRGVRAQKNAPYAIANIKKAELNEFSTTGKELPFLFSQTPGVLAWSENGLGTGTTYMRIRGAGDSRINVTLDGVPLNSPEDQCVFWANMNSYGSLLGSVFDGAYHETNTDGFIHGTSGRSGSYYGGLTWIGDKFQIRYKNIGNFEKTGQAWNGVTAGTNDLSIMDGTYGSATGIKTYEDMWDKGLGKFNSLYEAMIINDDGTYSTERYKMSDGSYWDKTTDNFWQNHNILSASWNISDQWSTSVSLHYTYGYGYYREFRPNNKLSKFGLTAKDAEGNKIKKTDFVRKKGLSQNTYGLVWNANYTDDSWDVVGGVSVQRFDGNHFGYLTYAANENVRQKFLANGDYKYYDSDAIKVDYSHYLKAAYHINEQWDVFGDLQFRYVSYKTDGINDKFYDDASGYFNQPLDIDQKYGFFNPKAGFSWSLDGHRVYGSVAMSHREPERNNFTDNGSYPAPKAEQMMDFELGYTFTGDTWQVGLNGYYMKYDNQFVQTGALSDIGENLTTNIKDSYRAGLELQAGVNATSWLTIEGNAALSTNKIKDFDEYIEDWDDWEGNPDAATYHCDGNGDGLRQFHYDNSTLAFSPSLITNVFFNFHYKGWLAVWHGNYVSRQYLDNTECEDRSLPEYAVANASLSYTLKPRKVFKECIFGLNFNNIFNRHYAASGWAYSAVCESYGHSNNNRYYQIGFIPMAGFTMAGNVTLRF